LNKIMGCSINWNYMGKYLCAKTKFREKSFPPPHPNLSIHYKICSDIETHKHGNYPLFTIISRLTALHLPSLKLSLDMKPV